MKTVGRLTSIVLTEVDALPAYVQGSGANGGVWSWSSGIVTCACAQASQPRPQAMTAAPSAAFGFQVHVLGLRAGFYRPAITWEAPA